MTSPRLAFAATVVVTLAGQFCALAYEMAIAGRFGTGREADVLAVTLLMALAVANELVTWVSALFVPHYAAAGAGTAAGAAFFRASLAGLVAVTALLAIILAGAAPGLMSVLLPDRAMHDTGVNLLRAFTPLILLMPLAVLLGGLLQTHRRFVVPALRPLCWYGGALVAVILLSAQLGPMAVPAGMVFGLVVFGGVLTLAVRSLVLARNGEPAGPRLRTLMPPLLPLIVASAANYVNVTVERGIAARLPEGSVAALTYAFRLLNFPLNLLLLNAAAMLFPTLALQAARAETADLVRLVNRTLRLIFVFTVPLMVLSAALAEPLIRVLLERGAFTSESTRLTAIALVWYAPALLGIAGGQMLLPRVYQALHDVRRMVAISSIMMVVNIGLMVTLTAALGFRGLPLATSLTALGLFALLLGGLWRRLPGLDVGAVLATAGHTMAAGTAAGVTAGLISRAAGNAELVGLVAGGGLGLVAYVVALFLFSRDDLRLALELMAPRRSLSGRAL